MTLARLQNNMYINRRNHRNQILQQGIVRMMQTSSRRLARLITALLVFAALMMEPSNSLQAEKEAREKSNNRAPASPSEAKTRNAPYSSLPSRHALSWAEVQLRRMSLEEK